MTNQVNEITIATAKRWLTIDEIYDWFNYVKTFCKSVRSININDQYVRDVITDARHAQTFVQFCDHVVLHRNVRII